jgi:hypothetical protein
MKLINGALSKNIYWAVGSSASIGNAAFFAGNLIAQSSIAYASYAILNGRGLSFADVSFAGYSSASLPNGNLPVIPPSLQINLGACSNFAALAYNSILFSTTLTIITEGSVGSSPGASVTGNYRVASGTTQINSTTANQCNKDIATAYNAASGATCTTVFAAADISGKTLPPGVYCSTPGTFLTGAFSTLTLDAQDNPNAVWIFQTATTIITGANSVVILKNKAQFKNVFWAIGTAVTLGSSSFFVGNILALTAITMGTNAVLKVEHSLKRL